jgi:2,3-bisphosphoglycerate-independent phosphoglycerate mutase
VVRIDQTIKNGELNKNDVIMKTFKDAKEGTGRLHLAGLISDGGVHAKQDHLYALLKVAKEVGIPNVYIHFFGDGRDTDPKSGAGYMQELLNKIKEIGIGQIATVVGRYYAMDRDKRWERVEVGMNGMCIGDGEESSDPVKTIEERYGKGENDEFLKPIIVGGKEARVKDGDNIFFFNYRSDRVREITQLLGDVDRSPKPDFPYPKDIKITTMTQYKLDYPFAIAFKPQHMGNVLAETLGTQGVNQVHVAETEKYAHVTFFFNGGTEAQFPLEERRMIDSPKVATYDLQPTMSAQEVADKVAEEIVSENYPFVMCNFAPPDMVGHTGVYEAAIKGVEATDAAIGTIYEACKANGYVLFITSDHGNAEKMLSDDFSTPHTAHTTAPVPFIMASEGYKFVEARVGALCDVAATVLRVMGLDVPEEMSGVSLLQE